MKEKEVGTWCNSQRCRYKDQKMEKNRIKKLNNIPGWYWVKEDPFYKKYDEVILWISDNKKIPSMGSKDLTEKKLGGWCSKQRQDYQRGKISKDKIKRLEKITLWFWKREDIFDKTYNELINWIDKNNKIPSSHGKDPNQKKLGQWCIHQRGNYKKGKLSKNAIKKLEKITIWSWIKEDLFDERYNELIIWIDKNNRLPSKESRNDIENRLGHWCNDKRKYYQKGTISSDQIEALEKIDIWYWKKKDIFDQRYDDLKKWIFMNGNLPSMKSKNPVEHKLGIWCGRLRKLYNNNKIIIDHVKALEKLDGWYWKKEDIFDKQYDMLKKWIKNNNDELPKQRGKTLDEKKLGLWCRTLRRSYKKGTLSSNNIKALEKIDTWYWEKRGYIRSKI